MRFPRVPFAFCRFPFVKCSYSLAGESHQRLIGHVSLVLQLQQPPLQLVPRSLRLLAQLLLPLQTPPLHLDRAQIVYVRAPCAQPHAGGNRTDDLSGSACGRPPSAPVSSPAPLAPASSSAAPPASPTAAGAQTGRGSQCTAGGSAPITKRAGSSQHLPHPLPLLLLLRGAWIGPLASDSPTC